MLVHAINQRDYPVVQGCVLAIAASFVLANALADVVNAWLDPRTRRRGARETRTSRPLAVRRARRCVGVRVARRRWRAPLARARTTRGAQALAENLRRPRARRTCSDRTSSGATSSARVHLRHARLARGRASITVALSLLIGAALGALAGFAGGWVDELIDARVDVLLAFPGLLLAIALTAVLGPSLRNVVIALCLIGWTGYARLARGEVARLREREFVEAAARARRAATRIVLRHVLPLLARRRCSCRRRSAWRARSSPRRAYLLGLGAQPPTPSWGAMLAEGRAFMLVAPHLTVFPGLAIVVTVLGLNFLGDGLRDRLDVRAR